MRILRILVLILVVLKLTGIKETQANPVPADTTVYLKIQDTTFVQGDTILMPVYGSNFYNIGSVGLFIKYDTSRVRYYGIVNGAITGAIYNAVNGVFMLGWTATGASLNFSSKILFYLKLYYFGTGKANLTFQSNSCTVYTWSPPGSCNISLESGSISTCTPSASVITNSNPLSFCYGDSCVLNANIVQNAKYQWRLNNNNITGATNTSYSAKSAGTFQLVITNAQNCSLLSTGLTTTVLTVPTITSVVPGFACGSGTVTLKANASSGTVNWYSALTGGTALYSGTTFTTPALTIATNYYTDATYNGCTTKSRTLVTASINIIPLITSVTGGTHCGPGQIQLTASSNQPTATINWYSASTGGASIAAGEAFTTPSISATTNYYTDATLNGCTTQTRTAVLATLKPVPIISSTTGACTCGSGSLVLNATVSSGTINWYNTSTGGSSIFTGSSYTTPLLTSTTTYYTDVTLNGCISPSRTSVTATIKPIPQITGTTPGIRCGSGVVIIGAVSSYGGTINWYSKSTGGARIGGGNLFTTPSITATTTYYTDVTLNGCKTLSTTPVTALISPVPTVSKVTPASACGKSSLILGATASKGIIRWHDSPTDSIILDSGATFTTPVLSASRNYYADAKANGCVSSSRTIVNATINQLPKVTLTAESSTTFCEGDYVIISINQNTDTLSFSWLQNGNNLSSAKSSVLLVSAQGKYSVMTTDSKNCIAYSDTISVLVNPLPIVNIGGNKTMSAKDSIVLDAGSGYKSYLWSNKSTTEKITLRGSQLGAGSFPISVTVTNSSNCEASSSMTLQVTQNSYTIGGYLIYDNAYSTPLQGQKVILLNINGEKTDSVNTDATGHYVFNNVSNGKYKFNTDINLKWGGADPVDALLINRTYLHVYTIVDKLKELCADVNGDKKINPTDALMVNRVYIHTINSFKISDWLFITDTVNVNNANVTNNLKAICAGDVSGSFVPPAKVLSSQFSVLRNQTININKNEPFDLPVYLNDNAELGALGLKLKVQSSMIQVLNVRSDMPGLLFNIRHLESNIDEIDIAWSATDNGYNISPKKPLFVLSAQCLAVNESINNSIEITSESVISDLDINTISTEKLVIPELNYQSSNNSCQLTQNYPNPFNGITTINYSITEDATVNINVYNVLGEKVSTLVNEFQSAGKYSYKFDRNGLNDGIYYCRMNVDNGKSNFRKTNVMMITK